MQLVWERVVSARPTVRREVRTPEMGELRVARDAYRRMQRRGVQVEVSWEPAEHNRLRKGTADGRVRLLARLNMACDLLAGKAADGGRDHELQYFGVLDRTPRAAYFWAAEGSQVTGDPYQLALDRAAAVMYMHHL